MKTLQPVLPLNGSQVWTSSAELGPVYQDKSGWLNLCGLFSVKLVKLLCKWSSFCCLRGVAEVKVHPSYC